MVEAAYLAVDDQEPFPYTPFFVLYGDGTLVQRACQNGACRYLQAQLNGESLCRLVNSIDQTGFLDADPAQVDLPAGTGTRVRLAVQVYQHNQAHIPDLDRWAHDPDWYRAYSGCPACPVFARIDPAFIDLYRLLTTFAEADLTGLTTDRLAVWLAQPVVAGDPQTWPGDLISLANLAEMSRCPGRASRQSAVIFEGQAARSLASYLSTHPGDAPIFTQDGATWQVHTRWLLPCEMPQTCDQEAGLFPPADTVEMTWTCSPEFGFIPTATPTITPTPTITATPLR